MLNQGSELFAGLVCVLLKTKYLSCFTNVSVPTALVAGLFTLRGACRHQ